MQMRALLFVAILTSGITDAMEAVEKAVATALGLTGAFSLSPPFVWPSRSSGSQRGVWNAFSCGIISIFGEEDTMSLETGLMSCRLQYVGHIKGQRYTKWQQAWAHA